MTTEISPESSSRKRVALEALGWACLIGFFWGLDLLSKIAERESRGAGLDDFHLYSEQITSGVAVLLMVIFVVYWIRLFPLQKQTWVSSAIGQLVGSILFAFGHYALTVLLRDAVHLFADHTYIWRENFVTNLIVEFQKDVKIYVAIVAIASAYQYYRRTQGAPQDLGDRLDRLRVQTGSGEAWVNFANILYFEASRNYVEVHTRERTYLLRETIANIEERMNPGQFVRCHRSYVVNTAAVAELKTIDGASKIVLQNDVQLPLSRGYRQQFEAAL